MVGIKFYQDTSRGADGYHHIVLGFRLFCSGSASVVKLTYNAFMCGLHAEANFRFRGPRLF